MGGYGQRRYTCRYVPESRFAVLQRGGATPQATRQLLAGSRRIGLGMAQIGLGGAGCVSAWSWLRLRRDAPPLEMHAVAGYLDRDGGGRTASARACCWNWRRGRRPRFEELALGCSSSIFKGCAIHIFGGRRAGIRHG